MLPERQNIANKVHYPDDTAIRRIHYRKKYRREKCRYRRGDFYVRPESPEETKDNYAFEQEQMTAATANPSFYSLYNRRNRAAVKAVQFTGTGRLARNQQFAFIARDVLKINT